MEASREPPRLRTRRLVLRAFGRGDAPRVRELAGAREVAANTLNIPHPYEEGMAEAWISTHPASLREGRGVTFAMERAKDGGLIGAIGLEMNPCGGAELGSGVGVAFWGRGYATEAAREVVRYAFEELGLHRVYAGHFGGNEASGRVMAKAGLRYEGTRRDHYRKWGEYRDCVDYGLLSTDYFSG